MNLNSLKIVIGFIAVVGEGGVAPAQNEDAAPKAIDARCELLATTDFSAVQDAPTKIMEARLAKASGELPAHCLVTGYVTPNVGFELLLPENWNGKFLHVGCGGFCGKPFPTNSVLGCGQGLHKGYACITTDMGHQATMMDAPWAYGNLQAEIDYAYRATHVGTLAGKAITERYFSRAPKMSYFSGCSGGGRQALVSAQRFPWDFDGIIAMEPAINFTEIFTTFLWNSLAVRDSAGNPILTEADARLLHDAVLVRCDLNDGIKDGLIGDPRSCNFDPAEITCGSTRSTACLTPEKVKAAKKVYAGPETSAGEQITKGGVVFGAESGPFGISNFQGGFLSDFAQDFFRYMAFMPDPGPSWKPSDFDFDRDYKRLGMMEALYSSTNPDLRKFKARGGKLILTQGWHDAGLPFTFNSIDYYETTERTMGGRAATQEFFRLYMVPGREHCYGGEGAWAIDHLSYLESWVEEGKAPDVMVGYHPRNAKDSAVLFPLAEKDRAFERPIYPYPVKTKYKGSGDPNRASSFGPVRP